MGKVIIAMSMSLDGYVTGPDVSPEAPMGRGGDALHEWMMCHGRSAAEHEAFETNHFSTIGALIIGRPHGRPRHRSVTHRPAQTIVKRGGTSVVFVTAGIDEALRRAREAAGAQDVTVNAGADIARRYLHAGAVQELRLHLGPVVLGAGTRLFDDETPLKGALRRVNAAGTPVATHLTYEVSAAG